MAKNGKSRRGKWIVIILGLLVLGGGAFWYFRGHDQPKLNYMTEKIERGDLTQVVTATGTLNPVTNVLVGCQVSGRIKKIYVDFNSTVTNGQLIAQLDPRTYEAQVEQAKADVASAKANLELQQVETRRSSDLFTNKLISASDYDTAIATLHEAQATVQIKEAALNNAEANLSYCDIYSPVDGVVISRNVDVGQTVAASLNAPTLFQIANDLTEMQIDTAVDEADIGGVKTGESAEFTVDAYPNRTFHGVVTEVRNSPTNSNNVVTYDTIIDVTNSDYSLRPGMTANVSIIVADREDVLVIPNSALRFQPPPNALVDTNAPGAQQLHIQPRGAQTFARNEGRRPGGPPGRGRNRRARPETVSTPFHTIYLVRSGSPADDATLVPVRIKTGITDNINTEVLSGLKEGDDIVTGIEIPGLTSDQRSRNPFAFRRRF